MKRITALLLALLYSTVALAQGPVNPGGGGAAGVTASGTPWTLAGTSGQTYTLPTATSTLAILGANTYTGTQTFADAGTWSATGITLGANLNFNGTNANSIANIAYSGQLVGTTSQANAIAVGQNGTTTPAFRVDASTASQTGGLKITGSALNGTVAVAVTDTSGNTNLTINALGTGTIGIGSVSTGAVTITPNVTHSGTTTLAGAIAQTSGTAFFACTTTNSSDTFTCTASPAITAYTTSAIYLVKFNAANTTTTPTINMNTLGAKTIVKRASTALAASDITANGYYWLIYNGSTMQIVNPTVN